MNRWMRRPQRPEPLLEDTITWLLQLPPHVRPHSLARLFPRVANMVAPEKNPVLLNRMLSKLMFDPTRHGRRGFPLPVRSEILTLREFFERKFGAADPWSHVEHNQPASTWPDTDINVRSLV